MPNGRLSQTGHDVVVRPSVVLSFAERQALAQDFLPIGPWGGFFIRDHLQFRIGTELDLEVVLLERKIVLHTRGMVRWRRPSGSAKTPAGVGVEFLESERQAAQMIRTLIDQHEPPRLIPRGRRYPASVSLAYARDKNQPFVPCTTDDISREGAFLLISEGVHVGEHLCLRLWNPEQQVASDIPAKVIWRGGRGSRSGVGVRFDDREPHVAHVLTALIDRIASQMPPLPEGLQRVGA